MAHYLFEAKSLNGKTVKGKIEAANDTEARVKLRAQQLLPVKLSFVEEKGQKEIPKGKVKAKELQVFTRQFSVLINAGVPIVDSLEAMAGGGKTQVLNKTLQSVVKDIEEGKRLADALASYPNVFDRMYVNLVRAGEEGGVLDVVLQRLAEYIEKSTKLKGKVIGALWYPAIIIVIALLVIAAMLVFVVPSFVTVFKQGGKELPALTQMVINLSDLVKHKWYIVASAFVAIPYAFKAYHDTPEGKKQLDAIFIDVPLFGMLIQKNAIARFSRTLSTLLSAGVRIADSLDIASGTAGNYVIEKNILAAKESILQGKNLAVPMKQSKYIPDMVAQMISVGEQSGNLDTMLSKIADFYEDEVETTAEALTTLVEPLLMVGLGGIIAFLVIAMYLPIFNLADAVG